MNLHSNTPSAAFIRCDNQRIGCDSIIWLEGDYNYTYIHQLSKPTKVSARTLKWYESRLTQFIRVRRDAMVNPAHIRAVFRDETRPDQLKLLLSNGEVLPIARRRLAEVRQQVRQSA